MSLIHLSTIENFEQGQGSALVMVGSFAPVHEGHFDAIMSAERAMIAKGEDVSALVFAPNSDSYVSTKLKDTDGDWNFQRRISEFMKFDFQFKAPAFIDDITGRNPPERSISEETITTIEQRLGIQASKALLVVGSDQVASMKPHLEANRAVCVIRPGSIGSVLEYSNEDWFSEAVRQDRYILTERNNRVTDISSTKIRADLARLAMRINPND